MWKIILSDKNSDLYESNLMRRICGLLYLSDKISGEIKQEILKENNKAPLVTFSIACSVPSESKVSLSLYV